MSPGHHQDVASSLAAAAAPAAICSQYGSKPQAQLLPARPPQPPLAQRGEDESKPPHKRGRWGLGVPRWGPASERCGDLGLSDTSACSTETRPPSPGGGLGIARLEHPGGCWDDTGHGWREASLMAYQKHTKPPDFRPPSLPSALRAAAPRSRNHRTVPCLNHRVFRRILPAPDFGWFPKRSCSLSFGTNLRSA